MNHCGRPTCKCYKELRVKLIDEISSGKFSEPPYPGNEEFERGVNTAKKEDIEVVNRHLLREKPAHEDTVCRTKGCKLNHVKVCNAIGCNYPSMQPHLHHIPAAQEVADKKGYYSRYDLEAPAALGDWEARFDKEFGWLFNAAKNDPDVTYDFDYEALKESVRDLLVSEREKGVGDAPEIFENGRKFERERLVGEVGKLKEQNKKDAPADKDEEIDERAYNAALDAVLSLLQGGEIKDKEI